MSEGGLNLFESGGTDAASLIYPCRGVGAGGAGVSLVSWLSS